MISSYELKLKIKNSKYPVAFTGAGVSVPSGVPSFDRKYLGYHLSEILNIDFFKSNSITFYRVYAEILKWTELSPNIVHNALYKLNMPIITQNIDRLHTKAGSKDIVELHGNLGFLICQHCNYKISSVNLFNGHHSVKSIKDLVICKSCKNVLFPNLVLIGQPVQNYYKAVEKVEKADILLVIGNSLKLWPANQLIKKAQENNCEIIIINNNCELLFNFVI